MAALRRQLAWLVKGAAHAQAVHDDHAQALQALDARLSEVEAALERSGADFGALPRELRASVDDLSDRIGALHQRYEADHG